MHWHGVKLFFVTLMQLKHTKSVPTWARAGAFGLELVFNYFNTIENTPKLAECIGMENGPVPSPKCAEVGAVGLGVWGRLGMHWDGNKLL